MSLQVINHLFKLDTINYNCTYSLVKPPHNVSMPQNILRSPIVNLKKKIPCPKFCLTYKMILCQINVILSINRSRLNNIFKLFYITQTNFYF